MFLSNQYPLYKQLINDYLLTTSAAIEHDELKTMADHALSIGGKRIRPVLCLLTAQSHGMDPRSVLPQAAAIEMFHAFSLVHDDIMDEAPTRRGQSSIYKSHGRDKAILAGDAILILTYGQLFSGMSATQVELVSGIFNKMALQVCEGQMMDMEFEGNYFPDQKAYMKMIEKKTSVLIGTAMQIGALRAGADIRVAESWYRYGVLQGLIFQIQDDILDAFGDPAKTGKTLGGDIARSKKTLLTILCRLKSGDNREKFESLFFNDSISDSQKINSVLEAYNIYGIKEDALLIKDSLAKQADDILKSIPISGEQKSNFVEITSWLMNRSY